MLWSLLLVMAVIGNDVRTVCHHDSFFTPQKSSVS